MIPAVRFLISKLFSPLWRRAENEDAYLYSEGMDGQVRQVRGGVVTQLCQNYGLIDQSVYFTSGEVLGGVLLRVGDLVHFVAVRDGAQGGWRALRVERQVDYWEAGQALELDTDKLRPLIGTVTSYDKHGGYINKTTYFPQSALCEGFDPMIGDMVQAQYFISSTECSSQAQSVAPLRYNRMDNVYVSHIIGRNGVVGDSVYFCLDFLLLPDGYTPTPGDMVSIVVVESNQSIYCWRALCMAPIKHSLNKPMPVLPETEIQTLLENKGGLVVSQDTQFGPLLLGESKKLLIWIHNKGCETHHLNSCEFAGWDSEKQFTLCPVSPFATDSNPDYKDGGVENFTEKDSEEVVALHTIKTNLKITPGEKVSFTVDCKAKNVGRCSELLLLHFSSFTIGRRLELSVRSEEEILLKPSTPYCSAVPLTLTQQPSQVVTVMAPAPPVRLSKRHLPNFLRHYPVPQTLREFVEAGKDVLVVQPALGEPLSLHSMLPRFSALLWLEELHAEKELKEFSISGALLRKGAAYLHLEVPGLSEGRPNLFLGDNVVLKKTYNGRLGVDFMSYVTEISEEEVSLRVSSELYYSYQGEPLDVEFMYNRLPIRRCHCALEQISHFGENVLFPKVVQLQSPVWAGEWGPEQPAKGHDDEPAQEVEEGRGAECDNVQLLSSLSADMVSVATQTKTDLHITAKSIPSPGQFFNTDLNPAQKEAVKHILRGECRPTPYILFGPPGTGKTITLIEVILQVYYRVPGSRMLVCTPSNSAADLICIRLHKSGYLHAASLARVNATSRQEESIPEVLHQYSRAGEDVRNACFHRIVVSTCSSASMFFQIGLRVGHFTHVFLDEAGQATEPESLIPFSLLSEKTGQIVLAGDPKQLGPIVKSKHAQGFGLGVSLLERLMTTPLYSYSEKGYNPLLVTKLVYNYRSHEALLLLPSRLFYGGELCVRSERAVVDSLCHWSCLPTKGFPLIFHGTRGSEMREGSNPSWFNPEEAVQVMLYCCQLAKKLYNPIPASNIGIITPYKKQVEKIRVLLHKVGLSDIKVGSVEEFQGQEFLVIILSTVRSSETVGDVQTTLGFLSNPKRFNVAITRAKALLIIIGNPHVLIKDPCFHALLQYSYKNGAFIGCDPPVSLRAAAGVVHS